MKKKIFFQIFFLMVLFNSCKSPLGLDEVMITPEANQYFPATTGSYWIYENVTDSLTTTDSVVVTGKKFVDGYMADEYTTYRNSQFHCINYYVTDKDKIYLFSKVLEPLIDTIESDNLCYCGFKMTWKPIVKFNESWNFDLQIPGDKYPSLVLDTSTSTSFKTVLTATYHRLAFNGSINSGNDSNKIRLDNSVINTNKFIINCQWLYGLDTTGNNPKNIQFKVVPGVRYLDNYRTIIAADMILDIYLSKNIGIVRTEGTLINAENKKYSFLRTLLRYKIN